MSDGANTMPLGRVAEIYLLAGKRIVAVGPIDPLVAIRTGDNVCFAVSGRVRVDGIALTPHTQYLDLLLTTDGVKPAVGEEVSLVVGIRDDDG